MCVQVFFVVCAVEFGSKKGLVKLGATFDMLMKHKNFCQNSWGCIDMRFCNDRMRKRIPVAHIIFKCRLLLTKFSGCMY